MRSTTVPGVPGGVPARFIHSIGSLLRQRGTAVALWLGLSLAIVLVHVFEGSYHNYIIFRNVTYHTLEGVNLYAAYPDQLGEVNLYGPLFSLVIAPFAWLPDRMGVVLWVMANAAFLLHAVSRMHLTGRAKTVLLLICVNEMMINSSQVQANALTTACLLLAFTAIQDGKESRALLYICFGGFIKLYALSGLMFFLFSRNRLAFIKWGLIWSAVFFAAPMLLSSPAFVVRSYGDWYAALQFKAIKNTTFGIDSIDENISTLGMISRIFNPSMNTAPVWLAGVLLFISQLLHWRHWSDRRYRYYLLASLLLFLVLFSNGSEACTYITAVTGMGIWYLLQPKTKTVRRVFFTLLILTTFIYSDLLGGAWTRYTLVRPYALKAFCPTLLWLWMVYQVHRRAFLSLPVPALMPPQAPGESWLWHPLGRSLSRG